MKFSAQEDVDAPAEAVFDTFCEFETFERAAMRRGAEVRRTDALPEPGVGASWDARFFLRGRLREVTVSVTVCERPDVLAVTLTSQGMTGDVVFEFISLSPSRTRLIVETELRPQTLTARLLVQSLKLSKGTITRKYKDRIAAFVRDLEARRTDSA